ncbi:hypothetical protein [Sinomonas humi]|nr:hypothetical protein [Sinomonas humi]
MKRRKPRTIDALPQAITSLLDDGHSEAARKLELILHQLEIAELVTDFA